MSDYIELKNIDFYQITVDNDYYAIDGFEFRNDKVYIIYKPIDGIKSINLDKDKVYKLYQEHSVNKEEK